MRIIFMGPPGAGKGTQSKMVATHFGIPAISTGEIFRANVTGRTALGSKAERYMSEGEYVPDEITNAMVGDRIGSADCTAGFILDGYPRTLAQLDALDGILAALGVELDAVLALTADVDDLVARLLQRAVVEGRADDTAEVIRRRQEVYNEQTKPLVEVFRSRGLLRQVDAIGEVGRVSERIFEALRPRQLAADGRDGRGFD